TRPRAAYGSASMPDRSERRRAANRAPGRPAASAGTEAPSRQAAWLPAMLVAALTILVYAHTFGGDFLRWDDPEHVTQNLRVTAPDGVARAWSETADPGFYPVTYMTWWAEWRFGGGKPWLFRLDNTLLHAANIVLAALVAETVGLAAPFAWLAAGVWGLH